MIQIPKKVLIFAAHQDDETIGCGGTIKKWSNQGSEIHVCFITAGDTGVEQGTGKQWKDCIVGTRMKEASKAAGLLGIREIHTLSLPCQRVSNRQQNFHKIIKVIRDIRPQLVITHNGVCKHRDHKRTAALVEEACWKASENILEDLGEVHNVEDLWSFEITDPHPNPDIAIDISETYEDKCRAMSAYFSQAGILNGIMEYIDGLSKVRGYSIGVKRAEAYTRLGRRPIRL